jgi:hypothetical protein
LLYQSLTGSIPVLIPVIQKHPVSMKKLLSLAVLALATSAPAAVIQFDLIGTGGTGLLFTNEVGVASGGTGGEILGGISFDNVTKLLTVNVAWGSANGFTNLTGVATNAHIHGPTASPNGDGFTQIANVMIPLTSGGVVFNSSASAGSIQGTVTTPLTAPQESALMTGSTYLNVHTVANGGGEIRGFLVVVPEPASALAGMTAIGALALRRRHA